MIGVQDYLARLEAAVVLIRPLVDAGEWSDAEAACNKARRELDGLQAHAKCKAEVPITLATAIAQSPALSSSGPDASGWVLPNLLLKRCQQCDRRMLCVPGR